MASTGVELPKQIPVGISSLILGGRIYHQIGSLMHTPTFTNPNPIVAQIYILDLSAELDVNKRYALPTAFQIAGLIPNSSNLKSSRQLIVYTHDNKLHYINSKNAAFEPLHFVLILFPHGEEGYHNQIPKQNTE